MLYEVITGEMPMHPLDLVRIDVGGRHLDGGRQIEDDLDAGILATGRSGARSLMFHQAQYGVITSYSIHYTKLYEDVLILATGGPKKFLLCLCLFSHIVRNMSGVPKDRHGIARARPFPFSILI